MNYVFTAVLILLFCLLAFFVRPVDHTPLKMELKDSAVAQLRKRSKDSLARPKAIKNITSKDPRLQGI